MTKKRYPKLGTVIAIPLNSRLFGFGLILSRPQIAVLDVKSGRPELPVLEGPIDGHVLFHVSVMRSAVLSDAWRKIGEIELPDSLKKEPWTFNQDLMSGEIYLTKTGSEDVPTTPEGIRGLERVAVWEGEHLEDRIRDHFAGRPNKWVESLRPNLAAWNSRAK